MAWLQSIPLISLTLHSLALLPVSILAYSSPELDLPIASIYEIDLANKTPKLWTKVNMNFDTVVENVEALKLECSANHPVQWIYTGNGIPALTSTNKYSRMRTGGQARDEYVATAFINPLKEHHTGKYICSPTQFLDDRIFFYIYVPGSSLFVSLNGRNIILPKNETELLIPCSVSHPRTSVTLNKVAGGAFQTVKVKSSDAVTYDPREGFKLLLDKIEDPEGTYVCTGRYGTLVRGVEYKVQSHFSDLHQQDAPTNIQSCKKECGDNAYCEVVDGQETCKCQKNFEGNPNYRCVIKCEAHTDCPSTMSCFVDRLCRDPCIHSQVGCGKGAKCKTENHRPVCYCPDDYVGNEMVECFNSLQGDVESVTPFSSRRQGPFANSKTPSSKTPCQSTTDCPSHERCMKENPSDNSKKCINPCLTRRCGRNAECRTVNHETSCQCLENFTGEPNSACSPIKLTSSTTSRPSNIPEPLAYNDDPSTSSSSSSFFAASSRYVDSRRPCAKPEECGPNSECKQSRSGNQMCSCKEGYQGQPPKCRPECKSNKDCAENFLCRNDQRVGYPSCAKKCGSRICGAHADCLEDDQGGSSECYCPDGFFGDPLVKCEDISIHIGRDCTVDFDCGIKLRCETGVDYRKCVDPCVAKNCSSEFVCGVEDHVAKCGCPKGSTGNEFIGCTKNADAPVDEDSIKACANLTCGQNGECRIVGGKPKCFCQSGYIGKPPACITECFTNKDCPSDLTCLQRRCRHRCEGCGFNTRCRVSPGLDRSSICSCIDGYVGNPYDPNGCKPYEK